MMPAMTSVTDAPPPRGLLAPELRALTLGLVLTITFVAFESLAVATIMPIVARELSGLELYAWVFSAFVLGSLLGIVVVGGAVDRYGLARPFAVGLLLFAAGLLLAGLAPSMPVLVLARLLQGLGAGTVQPTAYVAIRRALPAELRPRMFATLSTAWVVPGIAGPAIAGIIGEQFSWRVVFLGLLPLIAVAGALALSSLAKVRARDEEPEPSAATSRRLPNAVLVVAGSGLLIAGLTATSVAQLVLFIVAGALLVVPAVRRLTPPGTLLARRGLPAAVLLRGLLTFTFFGADVYVAFTFVETRGTSAAAAGIALTAATLSWTSGAWIQARNVRRWGVRRLVGVGFAVVVAGIIGFGAILVPEIPLPIGVLAWAVAGLGMGLAYSPLALAVLETAPAGAEGATSSALSLSDALGTALGTGIAGAIVVNGGRVGLGLTAALGWAFALCVVVGLAGAALSRRLPLHTTVRERAVAPEPA